MNRDRLAMSGFQQALVMHWKDEPESFQIVPVNGDLEILSLQSVIYAWYDRQNDVIMNVGLTRQRLKRRPVYEYERWLNGLLRDSPIRRKWLSHIRTSKSGLIEIHVRECDPSLLKEDEKRFMTALNPTLNVRR